MTRDQFIEGYLSRSGIPMSAKTDDGFRVGGREYVALPCACGDEKCDGWAKVSKNDEDIATHSDLYAPTSTHTGSRPTSPSRPARRACSGNPHRLLRP